MRYSKNVFRVLTVCLVCICVAEGVFIVHHLGEKNRASIQYGRYLF
jgi:hypothetical protein